MLAITAVTIGTSSAIMVFAAGGSLSEAILIGGVGLLLGLATAWYLGRLLSTIR